VRRSPRYVLSAIVGLGAVALPVVVDDGNVGLVATIPLTYGTTTALALDNAAPIRTTCGEGPSRTVGMVGAGIGAGGLTGLFRESFAAVIAGYGLFVFGMALVTAEIGGRTGE